MSGPVVYSVSLEFAHDEPSQAVRLRYLPRVGDIVTLPSAAGVEGFTMGGDAVRVLEVTGARHDLVLGGDGAESAQHVVVFVRLV